MKELYYEQVEQNVAYDLTNLWSKYAPVFSSLQPCSIRKACHFQLKTLKSTKLFFPNNDHFSAIISNTVI